MIQQLRHRLVASRVILTTTASLVSVSVLNGLVGFAFWWVAARYFSADVVGIAASAVSAMMLLGRVSMLGLGTTLIGELPTMRTGRRRLISTSLLATMGLGLAFGAAFALMAPQITREFEVIGGDALRVAVFATGVGLTATAAALDQVLIGLLRGTLQLVRNLIFSVGKLGVLIPAGLLFAGDGMAIYVAWVIGIVVSFTFMAAYVRRRRLTGGWRPFVWDRIASLARSAAMHHLLNVSRFAPASILPIMVPALLSSSDNAAFYIALLLANYVTLVGQSATLTLFAVGAGEPEKLWQQLRVTMALSAAAAFGGAILFWLLGRQILGLFGESYAETAYPAIALLALRGLPMLLKDHWVAVQRIRRGMGRAALLSWGGVVLEIGFSVIGARMGGLEGLAIGWTIAIVVQAAVLAIPVYRATRRPLGDVISGD